MLTAGYFFAEHQMEQMSSLEVFQLSPDEMAARGSDGDTGRRVAFPAMALLGVIC